MKALFLTIAIIILIPYTLYRIILGFIILNNRTKYNKSVKLTEWLINNDPIRRFFIYGTTKYVKVEKYKYKILKDDDDEKDKDLNS